MAGNRSGVILPGQGTGSGGPVRAGIHRVPAATNRGTAGRPAVAAEISGVKAAHRAHPEVIGARNRGTVAAGPERPAAAGPRTTVGHSAPIAVFGLTGAARSGRGRRENVATGPVAPTIAVVSARMIRAVGDTARGRAADAMKHVASAVVAPGRAGRSPTADLGSEAITDLRTAPTMAVVTGGAVTSADAVDRVPVPMIADSVPVVGPTAPTAGPAGVMRRARRRPLPGMVVRVVCAVGAARVLPGEPTVGHRVRTSRICPRTSRPVIWIRPSGAIC